MVLRFLLYGFSFTLTTENCQPKTYI